MQWKYLTLCLDVGGVLRDSKEAFKYAIVKSFKEHGFEVSKDVAELCWHLRGNSESMFSVNSIISFLLESCFGVSDKSLATKIKRRYKEIMHGEEAKKHVRVFPFVKECLDIFREEFKSIVIVTSGLRKSVERDLGELMDYFDDVIEDVERPNGEIPEKYKPCVFVGDTVADVLLAKRNGAIAVALLSGMGTESFLRAYTPCFIFKDLREFASFVKSR